MMQIDWQREANGTWPEMSRITPPEVSEGVYVIWHGGTEPGIVSVGHGNIGTNLRAEAQDKRFDPFKHYRLYVGWAPVATQFQPGIAGYLRERLSPMLFKQGTEVAEPIIVNLPWKLPKA